MPVRLRASLLNNAHASRFVNSRTTGTRPFDRGARAAVRLLVAARAGFFAVGIFATCAGFFTVRVDDFPATAADFAFRAGAFLGAVARLALVARLGPRATAFAAGFFLAVGLFAVLRVDFDGRAFVFIAHPFYASEAVPDRLPLFGPRLVQ